MGYDASGIYQLWNGHRVICSKDVIFDERPIQLLNAIPLLPSNATIPQTESLQPSGSRDPISMGILDETLENDGGECDYSNMPIKPSHANTDFSLTSLASTPDPTPCQIKVLLQFQAPHHFKILDIEYPPSYLPDLNIQLGLPQPI